jgi:hypothetical protein
MHKKIVADNHEYFDLEFYNHRNVEWATYTLDSKQVYMNFQ